MKATHYIEKHDHYVWVIPSGLNVEEFKEEFQRIYCDAQTVAENFMPPPPLDGNRVWPNDWAHVEFDGGKMKLWFEVTS